MKKFFIATAMAFAVITVANASPIKTVSKKISYKLNESFIERFAGAENVSWTEVSNNMMRANFTLDDESVSAFFNEEGELVATTSVIADKKLPSKLHAAINKKFENAVVIEAIELQNEDESAYFVKVSHNGSVKLLKGYSNGLVGEHTIKN